MSKVYDCFSFNGEWDLLELRLNSLDPVVDYFVITESNYTHMGKPKQPFFNITDSRLADFSRKIRYVLVSDLPNEDAWGNDRFQRNACLRGLWDAEPDDLILISDCDEIVKPHLISDARNHAYSMFGFQQTWYKCFMNNINVHGHPPEIATVGARFSILQTHSPDTLRWNIRGLGYSGIWVFGDAGWHYSYMMTKEQIVEKVQNFTHQEYNTPSVLSRIDPIKRAIAGEDILGREHMRWRLVPRGELDLPEYVRKHPEKYNRYFLEP